MREWVGCGCVDEVCEEARWTGGQVDKWIGWLRLSTGSLRIRSCRAARREMLVVAWRRVEGPAVQAMQA